MIYGVATISACMFAGVLIGNCLGTLLGTNSDIGGVGFAMILLILVTNSSRLKFTQTKAFSEGIRFWQGMYIPVVIAMAASQNVVGAVSHGLLAILAGLFAVVAAFALLPLINKISIGKKGEDK